MSDKPHRHWLQIRLSTAIVMMFVAGFLIQANLVKRETFVQGEFVQKQMQFSGWPLPDRTFSEWGRNDFRVGHVRISHEPLNVVANIIFALILLVILAVNLEYISRRRKRGHS